MKEYAELIITGLSVVSGAFFAYHKFMSNYIENMKRELWKEINKLQDLSDKRDEEIKELLRDMKNDIKIDLQFIKERMFPK